MKTLLRLFMIFGIVASASAQDWARAKLEKSPRHQEWAKVQYGPRAKSCFIVYPEVKTKAIAVILIHEIFGLTDWIRSVADQLAAAGYIAIAPDLLSGMGPNGGNSSDFTTQDATIKAIYGLSADQITADLNAVVSYTSGLPAANGKIAVAGFCWGGTQTFRFATKNSAIKSAFVFYGTAPDNTETIKHIQCPVYGFYGGNDARVGATIPKTIELMKKAGKKYEPVTYENAGHGFMRTGEAPDTSVENKKAHDAAWKRLKQLLKEI